MKGGFNILESEFFKNVSYQMVGTALAQLLPFAFTPLLTRIYSQEDFALYTSFYAVASILVVGVGGRYQFAIVLPRKSAEAIQIFTLSIYITICYSILLTLLSFVVDLNLKHSLGVSIYFLPAYVFFFGLWTSFSYLSVRKKTFFQNATAKVLQSVVYIVASASMGFISLNSIGLIVGRVFGTLASWIYLQRISFIKFQFPKLHTLKKAASIYQDYPKFGLVPAFLDIASVQGLVLILTRFYSTSDLGFYGLTALVLSAPLGLIGGSFKDVFYQKVTTLINANEFDKANSFFLKSALGLLVLGLPVCIIIYFFGPELFGFVFGGVWRRSGEFASLLTMSFLIQLIVSPLSSIFNAANKVRIASYWQTTYFVSTFLTLGVSSLILELKIESLLIVYVGHEILLYSLYFLLQYWTIKNLK